MAELRISDLTVEVAGKEIIHGIDLVVRRGEVHVVMGPNGSGKSTIAHAVAGRPGYSVTRGSVTLDGVELLDLPAWQRAQHGLFLAMQYPTEVPGVGVADVIEAAARAGGRPTTGVRDRIQDEAERIGLDERLLARSLNVDLSGGEKKRNETLQLAVLDRRFALLDELDSGLDVDGLRLVSRRIEELTQNGDVGVIAITHFTRVLKELHPDRVHVLIGGRLVASGGRELADELERSGYRRWTGADAEPGAEPGTANDPFADPFADPLA